MKRWMLTGMVMAFSLLGCSTAMGAQSVEFVTYGMPHEHVWGAVFDAFCKKYNCTHVDTDMSSSEAITKYVAEKGKPVAYATEAGILFGPVAVERGAAMAFKNKSWDKIPNWAKDPQGNWFAVYAGVPTFLVNAALVKNIPKGWNDLLKEEYKNTFAIKDPRTSGTALATFLAANSAMGGTLENIDPGIKYFKQLKEKGILNPVKASDSNIQKGEVPITTKYDHESLIFRENFKKEVKMEIVVPADGTIYSPSVVILNKWAPKPDLARTFSDFVTSDEGQLLIAKVMTRPILYQAGKLNVPADIRKSWLPDEDYKGRVKTITDWTKFSQQNFIDKWTKEVSP